MGVGVCSWLTGQTVDKYRTDTVWEWGCVFGCVGVRVCFGCVGVQVCFWLCGCAGVLGVSVGDWGCLGVSYFSYSFLHISRTSAAH